ncbi:hypothetical protein DH2020_042719 [Rehmannia glutinosa]|uniref:Uncharacterized protein n=1 Tax=Rehmannia glutinosa TaxID=99300 RepID=A0ABR0UML4_REHGL
MAKNPLAIIFDTNRLTGPSFVDWLRNLWIVLQSECREYVLDVAPLENPPVNATEEELAEHRKQLNDDRIRSHYSSECTE